MKRTAIFVDAGYLYAQGSACLQGSKAKRETLRLNHDAFLNFLKLFASELQPSASLLRIYWYDGTSRGPTADHNILANCADLKLRLGFINSAGQQKGVDSLLVTDLVELSRNGAICDALLLGGDEDLRIGVQIAQSFGVRVHLLGIEPSRGSQSLQLRQEADTTQEISKVQVGEFLSLIGALMPAPIITVPTLALGWTDLALAAAAGTRFESPELAAGLEEGIDSVFQRIEPADMDELNEALTKSSAVPPLYDRRVLASCRTALGRDLTMEEKKMMRNRFVEKVRHKGRS